MTEDPRTDAELAALIREECAERGDPEYEHCRADELVIEQLIALGYKETAEAWEDVYKWYA